MNRPSLILLIAALGSIAIGFSSCRDAAGPDASPTPTPAPDVTPTPAPDDESSDDSGDDTHATPAPSPDDSATPTPTPGGSTDNGAAMTSGEEIVRVTAFKTGIAGNAGDSTIEVRRDNGEVWRFRLTVTPNTSVGENITFRDTDMVFGDLNGTLIFRDGSSYGIASATRVQ